MTTETRPPSQYQTEVIERFWSKVKRGDSCWIWTAYTNPAGYGIFVIKTKNYIRAHRFSWIITSGPIPDGLVVCHSCDNPPCVRPDHLFIGTKRDNSLDMVSKGRNRNKIFVGELNGCSLLSDNKIREIIKLRREGWQLKELALRFNVTEHAIKGVVYGRSWKHITNGERILNHKTQRGERHPLAKLNSNQVREIRAARGVKTQKSLAVQYNVSESVIQYVQSRRSYGDVQ